MTSSCDKRQMAIPIIMATTIWIISSFNNGFISFLPFNNWLPIYPVWLLFVCLYEKNYIGKLLKDGWSILAFALIVLFSSAFMGQLITVTSRSFVMIAVAYSFYVFFEDKPQMARYVLFYFYFEIAVQALYGILMLVKNPVLIRLMLTSTSGYTNIAMAPGYAFVYMSIAMITYFISVFRYISGRWKWFLGVVAALSLYIVFNANLATALIVAVIFITLAFLSKSRRMSVVIGSAAGILCLLFSSFIGSEIVKISELGKFSVIISNKLYELGMSLQEIIVSNANASYNVRKGLAKVSMDAFFHSPLLGVYGVSSQYEAIQHGRICSVISAFYGVLCFIYSV